MRCRRNKTEAYTVTLLFHVWRDSEFCSTVGSFHLFRRNYRERHRDVLRFRPVSVIRIKTLLRIFLLDVFGIFLSSIYTERAASYHIYLSVIQPYLHCYRLFSEALLIALVWKNWVTEITYKSCTLQPWCLILCQYIWEGTIVKFKIELALKKSELARSLSFRCWIYPAAFVGKG